MAIARPNLALPALFVALVASALFGCDTPPPPKASEEPAVAKAPTPPPPPPEPPKAEAEPAVPPPVAKPIACPKPPKVAFNDPALEAEVRRKASKPEGEVTLADLKKVRSVDLTRGKTPVDSLDPCIFPLLTNLHHLYLGGGALTDLSPIKGLKFIEGLRVSMNQVSDLSPIAGMVQMDRLDLGRTQVRDLTPLKKMTKLTELMLDDTPVQDLSPIAGLPKLERLSIKRTRVTDVSPLKGLKKLKFLYVGGAPVENPQAAAHPGLKISGED
jgi:internalin A